METREGGIAMPKDQVNELVRILQTLRAPGGCPWDREQTHRSLMYFLVEETGELLDAVEEQDDRGMLDELGDVLLQIVFHCQIAEEEGRFDLQAVARSECEKMRRRHPHVFEDAEVGSAEEVVDQWEEIKRAERGGGERKSALEGVPRHLPGLHRAHKMQSRAAKVGFEWPDANGALAKVDEELREVREALQADDSDALEEEVGDLLFAVVNLARMKGVYAEEAMHGAIRKFEARFGDMEGRLQARGLTMGECSLEELVELWEVAKQSERASSRK